MKISRFAVLIKFHMHDAHRAMCVRSLDLELPARIGRFGSSKALVYQ